MDDQGEHDICEGQGDDEHLHGTGLSFAEHENQNDQQVENAAHNNYKTIFFARLAALLNL